MVTPLPDRRATRSDRRQHAVAMSVLFPVALAVVACHAAGSPAPSSAQVGRSSPPARNEHVAVSSASLPFLRTEPVSAGGSIHLVEAPARVAFRDGAVAQIGAPVAGRVQAVHVRLGDPVQAGAKLVTLGSSDAAGARAELRRAEPMVRAARLELERQTTLSERGVGLARDRVEAEAALAQAETELARARHANALIGRDKGGQVVIHTPIDGVVLRRAVTPGAVVEPGGEALLEIGDPTALWIVADVFSDEVDLVRDGATATVEVPGLPAPVPARVEAVGGAVDLRTRRAPVWLLLDGVTPHLRAGAYVRVLIDAGEPAKAVVPTSAVVLVGGVHAVVYVATADPGLFERRTVTIGRPVRGRVPVLEGLAEGDRVVVEGALLLDGAADSLL